MDPCGHLYRDSIYFPQVLHSDLWGVDLCEEDGGQSEKAEESSGDRQGSGVNRHVRWRQDQTAAYPGHKQLWWTGQATYLYNILFNLCTVKPRLSRMHLSGNTAIRTVFLRNEKTQCNFAPFSRNSVFPEPDSSLGNQSMFYNDHRSVLSGHAPEFHWLQG